LHVSVLTKEFIHLAGRGHPPLPAPLLVSVTHLMVCNRILPRSSFDRRLWRRIFIVFFVRDAHLHDDSDASVGGT